MHRQQQGQQQRGGGGSSSDLMLTNMSLVLAVFLWTVLAGGAEQHVCFEVF